MVHDFEEIIIVEAWKKRYANQLKILKKAPFSDLKSTPSFSIGVAIEFIVISLVTLFSCIFDSYLLWYGMFFGFAAHLVIHCFMSAKFKHYVPGVVTSVPFLPICVYLLYVSIRFFTFSKFEIIAYCAVGIATVYLMVFLLHKGMGTFEKLIRLLEKKVS